MAKEIANATDPIFDLGPVPCLPHCHIIEREHRESKWHYGIYNSYNAYGGGWADEDYLIEQITKEQKLIKPPVETSGLS